MKIKKNDLVLVITGKDRGKTGKVTAVLPKIGKVIVTGANIAKHHLKPSRKNPHGGIMDMPTPIWASNTMIICPHCGKPVKPACKISQDLKERVCRKCHGNLDIEVKNVAS